MEKTRKVMANVMAAINTFGIEYDTNFVGCRVERKLSDLLKGGKPVKYLEDASDGGKRFQTKWSNFISGPHYRKVRGDCWADDGDSVIIQFSRLYEMNEEDWIEYAYSCGCESPFEAQCCYGDPEPSYKRLNIRVPKGAIESFLRSVARYCWEP